MIRQTLAHFPHGALSGIGMLLFLAVFAGAVAWVYRRGSRHHYAHLAQSVLLDSESDFDLTKENV